MDDFDFDDFDLEFNEKGQKLKILAGLEDNLCTLINLTSPGKSLTSVKKDDRAEAQTVHEGILSGLNDFDCLTDMEYVDPDLTEHYKIFIGAYNDFAETKDYGPANKLAMDFLGYVRNVKEDI